MRSKAYTAIKENMPTQAVDVETACATVKKNARNKFDETIELHVHLGIDPKKSDQMVRGNVNLPAGTSKNLRIAVLAEGENERNAAQEAGAALTGGEELIEQIEAAGGLDAQIVIATPGMMPKIAKVAKILGPKGLMPNPKTGTVTPDPATAVKELSAGKVAFKMDQLGNIHLAVGKASWEAEKLVQNTQAALTAIKEARPTGAKGQLIKSITLKSTMSPAIRVTQ